MIRLAIDASIAVKWVVQEPGTEQALQIRRIASLIAPDMLVAECANILWKKVRNRELSRGEALVAARLLQGADIELLPTRGLLETSTRMAIDLAHPAYDCLYLALADSHRCRLVTADRHLLRKLRQSVLNAYRQTAISLEEAAALA